MLIIDTMRHRQLAQRRFCPADAESLNDPGRMRGRECEAGKGRKIEAELAWQSKAFGSVELGSLAELPAVIGGRVCSV